MKALLLVLLFSATAFAQTTVFFGQQKLPQLSTNCIPPELEKQIQVQVNGRQATARRSALAKTPVLFDWPLRQRPPLDYGYYALANYVDLNPAANAILDYNGGQVTYDGHSGIDITTQPFGWDMMDKNRVEVVAAAPGIIRMKVDGNYDRQCGGLNSTTAVANLVVVDHADGSTTRYVHLKSNSLTTKAVGQVVEQGEYLGLVGSSGMSSGPHLHFEVRDVNNNVIEPFAGPRNTTTAASRWLNQQPYRESRVLRLMPHSAAPVSPTSCSNTMVDVTNERRTFSAGDKIYIGIYGTYWSVGQDFTIDGIQPDGSPWFTFITTNTSGPYTAINALYGAFGIPNPAQTGSWRFRVTTQGQIYETYFNVNTNRPAAASSVLCQDSGTELTAMNGGQNYTYQWQRNGVAIAGATSERYVARQTGAYTVAATSSGVTSVSDPFSLNSSASQFSQKAGNWGDASVWSCGKAPLLTDKVKLRHAVSLPAGYTGQAFSVQYDSGGRLTFGTGSRLRLGNP